MVRTVGLEPTRSKHMSLNHTRLPVTPRPDVLAELATPLIYIPSLDVRRFGDRRPTPAYAVFKGFKW